MKRIIITAIALLFLTGCSSKANEVSITKQTAAPDDSIVEAIDPNVTLQMIKDTPDTGYIIYESVHDTDATFTLANNEIFINIKETGDPKTPQKHIFYLTGGNRYDTLTLRVNNKDQPFDLITTSVD